MVTALELKRINELKGRLEAWVNQGCEGGPFYGVDDPRAQELELTDEFRWSEVMGMLGVLRSEYIEQLATQFSSEPLVQKLVLVDSVAANARSK